MTSRISKTFPELLLESAMIVLSVLLALAASSWADSRKHDRLANQALQSFEQEIRANRARIAAVLPYQDSLTAAVLRADSLGGIHTYADWRRFFPSWSGFRPPDVTSSAWQSALSTGALSDIPYGTVAELSDLYNIQSKLDGFSLSYLPVIDFADAAMPGSVRKMRVYMQTVLSFERGLVTRYDSTLQRLATRRR
jgi:type II secretory pathway pseudopilin PulG